MKKLSVRSPSKFGKAVRETPMFLRRVIFPTCSCAIPLHKPLHDLHDLHESQLGGSVCPIPNYCTTPRSTYLQWGICKAWIQMLLLGFFGTWTAS